MQANGRLQELPLGLQREELVDELLRVRQEVVVVVLVSEGGLESLARGRLIRGEVVGLLECVFFMFVIFFGDCRGVCGYISVCFSVSGWYIVIIFFFFFSILCVYSSISKFWREVYLSGRVKRHQDAVFFYLFHSLD